MIPGILASLVFGLSLWLIFSEKVNRTIVAICGAALMVGLGRLLGFYSEEAAIAATDFYTLGLLLGMMLLVAMLEPTGFFQFLAVWAGRLSRGQPVRLLILLGSVTTILSMFLDNVTTVVLIAPVTILISEIIGLNPAPLLIAEALLSNTGGVATLIGDPPNVLIASASGLTFNDFLTHTLPVVVVAWLAALALLRHLFRADLPAHPPGADAVLQLNPRETLEDWPTARKILIVLGAAIALFFVHSLLAVDPALIALGAAAAALAWVRPDIHDLLKRVEWSVLIFFTALFVMVGGLEAAGVLGAITQAIARLRTLPPVALAVLLLWASAGLSAVVDNVPITIAMIPVIEGLGEAGLATRPLWWALAFGAGLGGNGTLIGSTANIVVATLSERTRAPITSALWLKRGLPVMLVTCAIASLLYVLAYPLFQ